MSSSSKDTPLGENCVPTIRLADIMGKYDNDELDLLNFAFLLHRLISLIDGQCDCGSLIDTNICKFCKYLADKKHRKMHVNSKAFNEILADVFMVIAKNMHTDS